jgi:hypothetical protein
MQTGRFLLRTEIESANGEGSPGKGDGEISDCLVLALLVRYAACISYEEFCTEQSHSTKTVYEAKRRLRRVIDVRMQLHRTTTYQMCVKGREMRVLRRRAKCIDRRTCEHQVILLGSHNQFTAHGVNE